MSIEELKESIAHNNIPVKGKQMEYKVLVTVKEVRGNCVFPHRTGDTIEFTGPWMKGKICLTAFTAIYPFIHALRFGAEFPWGGGGKGLKVPKDRIIASCSDPFNTVVFELRKGEKFEMIYV